MDKFLINVILVVLICGLIILNIGNFTLYKISNSKSLNLKTCDTKILEESSREDKSKNKNGYTFTFTGYTLIFMALLFLLISFLVLDNYDGLSLSTKDIIKNVLPVFVVLIIVTYGFILNVKFKDKLIKGDISNEYFSYLTLFSLILLVQFVILCLYILQIQLVNEYKIILYALSTVNVMILGVMNIILSYFTTDG